MQLFSKNEILTWVGIGLLLILPSFFAIPFTFPQADDYGYAELAMNHSWKEEFIRLYTEWSGRYTSIIAGFMSPLAFGQPALYGVSIFGLLSFFVFSQYHLFRGITASFNSKAFALICSLLFSAVYLNLLPSPGESIFWYSGIITYILPTAFLSLSIRFIINGARNNSLIGKIFGPIFLFLTLGGNEILTVLILLFGILILLGLRRLKSTYYPYFSKLFIVILIGVGTLFIAPGNLVRSEYFNDTTSLFNKLILSDLQIFRFGFSWISNISVWILFLFSLFIGQFAQQKKYNFKFLQSIPGPVFLFAPMLILYAAIFPAYLTMGMLGQQRTLAPAFFCFLIWVVFLGLRIGYRSQLIALFFGAFQQYVKVIAIIFIGVMVYSGNNKVIMNDLFKNRFETYFQQNIDRFSKIEQAQKTIKKASFKEFMQAPEIFQIMDIKEDPDHWINKNWARYYKIETVEIKK